MPPMTFFSPYRHEFLRVASCVPRIEIGDPAFNVVQTLDLARHGDAQKVALMIFPELGMSRCSTGSRRQSRTLRRRRVIFFPSWSSGRRYVAAANCLTAPS